MAVTVFPVTNPAVVTGGQMFDGWANGRASRNVYGSNACLDFVATGTDLTVKVNLNATGPVLAASVDGGAFAALTMPASANVWTDVPVFAGLADAAHTVRIHHTTGTSSYIAFDLVSSLSLTGAAPALAARANFGPAYPYLGLNAAAFSVEGAYAALDTGGHSYPQLLKVSTFSTPKVRFRARCSAVSVWTNNGGQAYQLYVDGAASGGVATAPNNGTYDWLLVASGLDAAAEHEYQLTAAGTGSYFDYGVMLGGGTGLNAAPAALYPRRDILLALGDSITAGNTIPLSTYPHLLAMQKGYALYNLAVSSTQAVSVLGVGQPVGGVGKMDVYYSYANRPPALVTLMHGHNDALSAVPAASFGTYFLALLQAVAAKFPAAAVLVLNVLDTTAFVAATRNAFNAQIASAVAALANPRFTLVDTTGWVNAGTDLIDGTHPNAGGYAKMQTQLAPLIPQAGMGLSPAGVLGG